MSDNSLLHFLAFLLPLKQVLEEGPPLFAKKKIRFANFGESGKTALLKYFQELETSRSRLLQLTSVAKSSEENVEAALTHYLAKLRCIENEPRDNFFTFQSKDVLYLPQTVITHSVREEMVNTMLSVVLWRCHAAALLFSQPYHGAPSIENRKALSHFRTSLSMLRRCRVCLESTSELSVDEPVTDCHISMLIILEDFINAEAQGLFVFQAIERQCSVSLISSIASSAQEKYREACLQIEKQQLNPMMTVLTQMRSHAQYKAVCFETLALAYGAICQLRVGSGGGAERLAIDAEALLIETARLGHICRMSAKDGSGESYAFQNCIKQFAERQILFAKSENHSVYYAKPAQLRPILPAAINAVEISSYSLPDQDRSVDANAIERLSKSKVYSGAPSPKVTHSVGPKHSNKKRDLRRFFTRKHKE